jgi:hypothetical protein
MAYKIKTEASKYGYRDGKDSFLLERSINNPYQFGTVAYHEYMDAWNRGYEEEQDKY